MRRNALKRITNKWTILSLIALIIVLGGGFYYFRSEQSGNETKAVETSTIGTGNIILSGTGIGTLIPQEDVSFGFKNSGQVSEVLASLGEQVKAGQVLARLDSKTLELKYTQAEATIAALSSPTEIASAAQAQQETKAAFASAKDTLQGLIGPDLLMAEDREASAQQDLQIAKSNLEKNASAENQQKVADAEAALTKAEGLLAQAQNNYTGRYVLQMFIYPVRNDKGTTIRRQLFAPTDTEIAVAQAAYELAQANLSDAQNYLDILNGVKTTDAVPSSSVTSITEAKLALDSAKANLDAAELTAPINGTITSINLSAGQSVGTSSVITISNLNQPYTIDASLDETDWDKAKLGFAATVTFDLLPNNNYSGKIIQVYPKLDDSSGTSMVHILVQLDRSISKDLPVGATASVDVTGGEALDAVLVPISALKEMESGKYIVYLMENGQLVQQEVEIGLQDILYAEVKSGLERGDVVLTDATTVNP